MRSILIVSGLCVVVAACGGVATPTPEEVVEPTEPALAQTAPLPTPVPTEVPTTPTESGPEEISWRHARANIGATARVCGEAVTVAMLLDGRTLVNLGEIPSEGGVIVVITDSTMFPEGALEDLYGEDICVTGEIIQDESKVGISVTDPAQIEMNE